MLYEKNRSKELADELFQNPTREYRGAPFWSWNCELDEKELLRQIEELKAMGFGGFHMHCRSGMSTEYLSDDFMKLVKACVKKAKKEDMLAWLYDEDRWPSGFAGGIVTKDSQYRGRYLVFSQEKPDAKRVHLDFGTFDVLLNSDGTLCEYRRLQPGQVPKAELYYAYEELLEETPRFNNQTYVDTLNPKAIRRFIEVTYDAYQNAVGKEFGKTVPAIFTDEPQYKRKQRLEFATSKQDVILPWTDDLEDSYCAEFGESILDRIPELVWDLPNQAPSVARYRYHAHVCRRFTEAFADQCGDWCKKNGLALTGHMMEEPTLTSQTGMIGEAMPAYRGFQIPGIDMLCARFEFNTAKQCQSAVRQYGREAMMSELYGVTSWDFDFRGYKIAGDWQAAMGVTVRVPHLAWVSMQGEAKRDYPAAIGYQSPWYQKFGVIEDHFSRLNTALTRGTPVVRVGVIHPIESFWLHWGPMEQSALACEQLESNFENINKWLSFGGFDFDYICETTFGTLCKKGSAPLSVGKMQYDVIIVPACETLRKTTVDRLEAFQKAGGKLIFMGDAPKYMDAVLHSAPAKLYHKSLTVSFSRQAILEALEADRDVEIRNGHGNYTTDMLYQMRRDGDDRWLFLCHAAFPYNKHISHSSTLRIKVKGEWSARLYDTSNGSISDYPAETKNGWTYITTKSYDYDSFLFRLSPVTQKETCVQVAKPICKGSVLSLADTVDFQLAEPNALLLDQAEYALDGEDYHAKEEILRIDTICRERLGWDTLSGKSAQPWCIQEEPVTHSIMLRFTVNSALRVYGAKLAIENPEQATVVWNGAPLSTKGCGWYVDRSIKTLRIPVINKGTNVLELTLPFGKRTATEWCYILGNFGTQVCGREASIVPLPQKLGYGNIVSQYLVFYSGALDYKLDFSVSKNEADKELVLTVPQYNGTLVEVLLDGEVIGNVVYPPYRLSLGRVGEGAHQITLRLYVPRTNGFGPVHLADEKYAYPGPIAWRTNGDSFGYEYYLKPEGIMMKPILEYVY